MKDLLWDFLVFYKNWPGYGTHTKLVPAQQHKYRDEPKCWSLFRRKSLRQNTQCLRVSQLITLSILPTIDIFSDCGCGTGGSCNCTNCNCSNCSCKCRKSWRLNLQQDVPYVEILFFGTNLNQNKCLNVIFEKSDFLKILFVLS